MAWVVNAHPTNRNNGAIDFMLHHYHININVCINLGLVSVLPESDYGVWTSKEQVGFLPALWCSFFGVVHLSSHCCFDCPSSPCSLEDKVATWNSLFSQFSRLCSHGPPFVANAVIIKQILPDDRMRNLKCTFYLSVLSSISSWPMKSIWATN